VVSVGTGTSAQLDGYRVAGKTGTARKPLDGAIGYEDGAGNFRYVASFVGFLPADHPELSIIVTIDQPTASIYASFVAAPAFAEIASYAVRHFAIAPPTEIAASTGYEKPAIPALAPRVENEAAAAPTEPDTGATEPTAAASPDPGAGASADPTGVED
jgi:membrane peptidoglycan carboxypeptidase